MKAALRWLCSLGLLTALPLAPVARAQSAPGQNFAAFTDPNRTQLATFLCVGQRYYFKNTGPRYSAIAYDFDSRDGQSYVFDSSFVYTTPGRGVLVTQLVNNGGPPGFLLAKPFDIYPTAQPRVRFDACLRAAQVTLTDPTYTRYTVQFGTSPVQTGVPGQTLTSPLVAGTAAATLTVRVIGSNPVAGSTATPCTSAPHDTTFALPAVPGAPGLRRLDIPAPTSARQVQFTFTELAPGFAYDVQRDTTTAAGAWKTVSTFTAATATQDFTLPRADLRQPHRYRLRLRNGTCTSAAPGPVLLSAEADAVPLALTTGNKRFDLRWQTLLTPAPAVRAWEVRRNGRRIATLPAAARAYTDPDVACTRRYCYEVVALTPLAGTDTLRAASADSCGVGTSTLVPGTATIRVSFDLANHLVLRATVPPTDAASTFEFFEQPAGGTFAAVGSSPTAAFSLPTPDTARVRGACYRVAFTDSCANRAAPSAAACPVVLRVRRTADRSAAVLDWTPYVGFGPNTTYHVQLLEETDNSVLREIPVDQLLTYSDDLTRNDRQIRRYRIRAQNDRPGEPPGDTARTSFSNFVDLTDEPLIRFPTAFTPNDDALNDTFGPVGRFRLREVAFRIYDRWGRQVFGSTETGAVWDGKVGGTLVTPGVYVYRFSGTDVTGKNIEQRGTVTVLR